MILKGSLLTREVAPFVLSFTVLVGATLMVDGVLHLLGAAWIGRHLGWPGVLLIVASFGYSLRKRGIIKTGKTVDLLRLHERLAWTGSFLLLIHAGIHHHALLPWLAVLAMLINIGSGLTGKFLLKRARVRLEATTQRLQSEGMGATELEERLHWDSLTFDAVKQWRVVHYPVSLAFGTLAFAHIVSIYFYGGWR
jgi:hypothetical protein